MASVDAVANALAYAAWLAQVLRSSRATPLPVDPLGAHRQAKVGLSFGIQQMRITLPRRSPTRPAKVGPSFGIQQILPAILKPARPGTLSILSQASVAMWRKVDALWSAVFAQVRGRPTTTMLPRGARMPVGTRSALVSLALATLLVLCLKGSGLPPAAHSKA